jgi:hypothetical protein
MPLAADPNPYRPVGMVVDSGVNRRYYRNGSNASWIVSLKPLRENEFPVPPEKFPVRAKKFPVHAKKFPVPQRTGNLPATH